MSKWRVSKAYPLISLGIALPVAVGLMLTEQAVVRAGGMALICGGFSWWHDPDKTLRN